MNRFVRWIGEWWLTWRVWRSLDPEQREILTGPFDPNDFVEVDRP